MSNYSGNGSSSSTEAIEPQKPKVLYDTMEAFTRAITQEFLIGSAIAPELFEAAVEIVCDTEVENGEVVRDPVADFLNWEPKKTQNGYSMKRTIFAALMRNEDGTAWQAKVNYCPWNKDKGKHGKPYLAPKKNGEEDPRTYLPPVPPAIRQKVADRYGVDVPMTGSFWEWVRTSGLPILPTEGAKKSLSALSQGIIAIAFYGCNAGYRLTDDKSSYRLIDQLLPFCTEGRDFLLAFDKDDSLKTQNIVAAAVRKLGALLQREGAIVRLVNWKAADGKGMDDVIVNKGVKFMERAIGRAKVVEAIEVSAAKPFVKEAAKGSSIQWTSGMYLVRHIEKILGMTADSFINVFGQIHQWQGSFYERQEDGILLKRIQSALSDYCYDSKGMQMYPFAKTAHSTEALAYLKTQCFTSPQELPQSAVCLKNGVLRVLWERIGNERSQRWQFNGFELVPHHKKYFFLSRSEVEYNPSVDPTDCDRLLKAIPDDQRQTWLEHLAQRFDFEKTVSRFGRPRAGLHEGTGSNGKDSCRQAIADIFTDMGGFTFTDFAQAEDGRPFSIASLPKYKLSWSSENNSKVKLENLKTMQDAISANGIMRSEFKNQNPVDFTPNCLFHFNVNKAPITDASDFVRSRFVIYTYPYTYSSSGDVGTLEADERYAYDPHWRIENVSSALLNRLCEAFATAWHRGGIDFTPCEARLKEWAADRNHVLQFCEAMGLEAGSATDSMEVSELWHFLENWYVENDLLTITNQGDRDWASDPSNFDSLIKKSADIFARLQMIFPHIKKMKDARSRRSVVCGLKTAIAKDEYPIAKDDAKDDSTHPSHTQTQTQQGFHFCAKDAKDDSLLSSDRNINHTHIHAHTPAHTYIEGDKHENHPTHPSQPSQNIDVEQGVECEGWQKPSFAHPTHPSIHPTQPSNEAEVEAEATIAVGTVVRYKSQFWVVGKIRKDGTLDLDHKTLLKATSANPGEVELLSLAKESQ